MVQKSKMEKKMMQQKTSNPAPTRVHFKNAAARAKFLSGKMTPSEARQSMVQVPIIRGLDRKVQKQLLNDWKYAAKINSPEWKAEAQRRKGEQHD